MAATRRSRPWHRVLGLLTALPLVWVVLTGAVLNRAADWGFDRIELSHPWILAAYGMVPGGEPGGVTVNGSEIVQWDGQLFREADALEVSGNLVGAVADGDGVAVVTAEVVLRLDRDGRVVEALDELALPELPLVAVANEGGAVWLQNDEGWHEADGDWLEFRLVEGAPAAVSVLKPVTDGERKDALRKAWSGGGLSLARVVLDLHAARFLGPVGKVFYDLVAVCTVWLCVTGLVLFFRKPKPKAKRRRGRA